jgi:ribulose-phosphate 3-epimerase
MPTIERLGAALPALSLGIFAADPAALGAAAQATGGWGAALLHFDVMDGVFVPQLTAGSAFVAALADGRMLTDVHLMVQEPARHVSAFVAAGADIVSVHVEAQDVGAALVQLRAAARPVLAGIAIMPGTPLAALAPHLKAGVDLVLILAVDPRDGSAADVDAAAERALAVRGMSAARPPLVAIDGGIKDTTMAAAVGGRPDIVVSGSAVFAAPDPEAAYRSLAQQLRG